MRNSAKKWRMFRSARKFARRLKLPTESAWYRYCCGEMKDKPTKPDDMPCRPWTVYRGRGWKDIGDWLGRLQPKAKHWRSFVRARAYACGLGLGKWAEWNAFSKSSGLPADIPATPSSVYRDTGWRGVGDWLGTGSVASFLRKFRPFKAARAFARSLKLRSYAEWRAYCEGRMRGMGTRPPDIPTNPSRHYAASGWRGIGDWLSTGVVATRQRPYRAFEEARAFVCSLGLRSNMEWRAFCKGTLTGKGKKPPDVPAKPDRTYRGKGWQSWGDWLGTGTIDPHKMAFLTFHKARSFARSLHLRSRAEWERYCAGLMPENGVRPQHIPVAPWQTYRSSGWQSMGDWLGTGTVATRLRKYRPFREARAFARSLGLRSQGEWLRFCAGELPDKGKMPPDIPCHPDRTYHDKGWQGLGDWLGTGIVATQLRQYRPFEKARAFVRSLQLLSADEWRAFCKGQLRHKGTRPPDVPTCPNITYRDKGWRNWGDWRGTGTVSNINKHFKPFSHARAFARSLKLRSGTEWKAYCKGLMPDKGTRPHDIPYDPHAVYRGKGWQSIGDWLGTKRGKNRRAS